MKITFLDQDSWGGGDMGGQSNSLGVGEDPHTSRNPSLKYIIFKYVIVNLHREGCESRFSQIHEMVLASSANKQIHAYDSL